MQVTIARFELYPQDDPTSYAVGFNVTTSNGRSFYRDTTVPLAQAQDKSDEEIVEIAWLALQQSIQDEVARLEAKPPLLGQPWNPPGA